MQNLRKKKSINGQISTFDFQCVSIYTRLIKDLNFISGL
jgi:hypothetical protein